MRRHTRSVQRAAADLFDDIVACRPYRLFSEPHERLDLAAAYNVQHAMRGVREERGQAVIGYKIGETTFFRN